MVCRELFRPHRRPEGDRGEVGRLTMIGPRNQSNDLGTHQNPSQTASATKPAKASVIRYAVMPTPFWCAVMDFGHARVRVRARRRWS